MLTPCYANITHPNVEVASYRLLKSLGVDVDCPLGQTCCGQSMVSVSLEDESIKLALCSDDLFQEYDYIVGPSASCVAFAKENHPGILEKERHVCQSIGKTYDTCGFIYDVLKPSRISACSPRKVSIHDGCHGVHELLISIPTELNTPYYNGLRDPFNPARNIEVFEPNYTDECCGLGGVLTVEGQVVSVCTGCNKVKDHIATGAEYIVRADSSYLMRM